jgi:hypothetical protein
MKQSGELDPDDFDVEEARKFIEDVPPWSMSRGKVLLVFDSVL